MNGVIKRSDPADDYELLQKVGHGTYGEVYKAKHVRSGELAAVKVVKLEAGDNFTAIQQEILVLMDCKHSNIISYFGSYLRRDKLWIVMEYCSGGSLQDIYQMTGPLTELQIAFVCRETLKGLQYLHNLGKIHRDVKGANILLAHSGDIKLADFGVAAQITATIGKRKSFIGTPYWMAPEVANVEQRGGYGVECDVWAVGITSIELAELQPPLFDLHPMQVLYLMTKSSYKVPKLKDKKKWSSTFHDFIKHCLTKNPKKRPSPSRLLSFHSFVAGALSSRLTRELLDRVNNPGSQKSPIHSSDISNNINDLPSKLDFRDESERMRVYHEKGTLLAKESSSSPNHLDNIKVPFADEEENDNNEEDDEQFENNEFLSRKMVHDVCSVWPGSSKMANKVMDEKFVRPTSKAVLSENNNACCQQKNLIAHESEIVLSKKSPIRNKNGGERSMSLGAFHHNSSSQLSGATGNLGRMFVKKRRNFQNGCQMTPLAARPQTIFGLVPTPQVSMGACFFNILHNCTQKVKCCATWTHPASLKQYLIIGAEEGIFTLDLFELHNNNLILIHERKCTWLYVIGDVMIALQGKTPYLYRHEILQLMQQQLITQKLTKTMTRIPEKYKPRVLLTTIRMPETRDCFKCCVESSVTNANIYMGCAVPDAVLLFQWYEPLSRFIMIKRVEINFGIRSSSIIQLSPMFCAPFSLVFGSNAANSDFPLICIGVCKISDNEVNDVSTTKLKKKMQVGLSFVDFNDTGNLEHFLTRSGSVAAELFDRDADATLKPFGKNSFLWNDNDRLDVLYLKQLDRETLFMAFEDKILLTDLEGKEKVTDLMKTSFTFDFLIDFAVPLPDSVLAFHKHGVQGRSFFRGSITQDLYDPSKIYKVIGNDSLIVFKCHSTTLVDCRDPPSPLTKNCATHQTQLECDLCILTGHISTLTPP